MRALLPLLMLSACAEEAPALLDDDWELAAEELPLDEAGPPIVAASVEMAAGQLLPNVFLTGDVVRVEAPVVAGRLVPARARCAWRFEVVGTLPNPMTPFGATWAFTVRYTPVADLVLQSTGVPSVCSPAVFPAGPGASFSQPLALDAALNQVLKETSVGWAPFGPNLAPIPPVPGGQPSAFEWRGLLRTWP